MTIQDLMTKAVSVIAPDASVYDAARQMAENDFGFLPVCDGDRLIGTLTDRDITVRAVAGGLDPRRTAVQEVMSDGVTWCSDDEEVERTAELMKQNHLRRIIVVDRNKRLVGVVSLGDLAQQKSGQSSEVLENVSGAPPNK
jgi:CBS domain-containing protein